MTMYRQRWIGALAIGLSCLLAVSCAAAQEKQEKKAEKKTAEQAEDKGPELAPEVKSLVQEVTKVLKGPEADRKQVIGLIAKHLESKQGKLDQVDAQIANEVAGLLERMSTPDIAGEAYQKFGKILAGASNERIVGLSKFMQGAGRRLGSMGKAIDIKGTTAEGKQINLSQLKGKVVLVDFWATWCGPCRAEIPNIKKLYTKYQGKFDVIGVSLDDDKDKLEEFLKDEKLPWQSIFDHAAKEGQRLADQYGVMSIPQAILVDQQGHVVSLEARGPELGRLLAKLIDKEDEK
jgi:thiol-disulfide isomerase/thioredoxin